MKQNTYSNLKNKFYSILEAIKLYDSGRHPEYNKDALDTELDEVHYELCDAASEATQVVVDLIDTHGRKVLNLKSIKRIADQAAFLADLCRDCYNLCYEPDCFDLNDNYGNGVVDSIGADFCVDCKRSKTHYLGYNAFFNLLEDYEIYQY